MANLLSQPFVQPVDANGNVLPGAKLITYFTGTTTPIAVYTDEALTIPHANPVIANSRGEFPQIYLSAAEHRLILTDSLDVQVAVYDNVVRSELFPAVSGNTVEILTASASQTVFTLSNSYVVGINGISVYIQGVLQHSPTNYAETSTTSITFTSGLDLNDEVTIVIPAATSTLVSIGTQKVTITDDNFVAITPPKTSGMIEFFAENTDESFGKLYFDVVTPFGTEAFSGSLFDVSTGALNGTTGVDGNVTVSPANDGDIYIENRLGSSKTFIYSFTVST